MTISPEEQVMVPLLRLLASGPRTPQQAIRELAATLPLPPAERHEMEVDFMRSPFNRYLSGAWNLLQRAALIESTGGVRSFRLSERGQALLRTNPKSLTIKSLERYPEFLEARERSRRAYQARCFRDLRLEYYAGGRRLMREGVFSAGVLLLSYAIEMALKAGMHTVEGRWSRKQRGLVGRSHDLLEIFREARSLGVFADTTISPEFLAYARDHFKRRYPSGEKQVREDRGGWSIASSKLSTYDDCICQLDSSLARRSGEPAESLVHAALHDPMARHLAEYVFDDNPFALRAARGLIEIEVPGLGGYISELSHYPERERRFRTAVATEDERFTLKLAALYRYPKHGEESEPDPDPLLTMHRPLHEDRCRWMLKPLHDAFGPRNVRVVELQGPRGCLAIQVFDRGAKQFWRQLVLGSPISDPFFALCTLQIEENRAALKAWIEETRRVFTEREKSLDGPSL